MAQSYSEEKGTSEKAYRIYRFRTDNTRAVSSMAFFTDRTSTYKVEKDKLIIETVIEDSSTDSYTVPGTGGTYKHNIPGCTGRGTWLRRY